MKEAVLFAAFAGAAEPDFGAFPAPPAVPVAPAADAPPAGVMTSTTGRLIRWDGAKYVYADGGVSAKTPEVVEARPRPFTPGRAAATSATGNPTTAPSVASGSPRFPATYPTVSTFTRIAGSPGPIDPFGHRVCVSGSG